MAEFELTRPSQDTVTNCCPKPRTVERCEAYLDTLAGLIAEAGEDWVIYQPLVARLEEESRQAREALAMRERMLKRQEHRPVDKIASPLPRTVRLVAPGHPNALTLDQVWQLAAPANASVGADDKHSLIMLCRNRRIAQACRNGAKSLAFVK